MNQLSRVLTIDLSKRSFYYEDRSDLFYNYLGGTGVGIHLLDENCPADADPLGSDNPIILAVGPLVGLFPLASKTVAMFKSPLTGNLGESHAGGRSAVALRSANIGALVIKGSSISPIYLSINENGVRFKDASAIWGIKNSITVGKIIRELENEPGVRTIMRIGGAGESLVKYASVTTETYRHFGRLGLGAVFGSKRLKAVCISGTHIVEAANSVNYRNLYNEIFHKAVNSPLMKKYHDYGTAANIMPLNFLKGLPRENLSDAQSSLAENISGEHLAENFLGRRVACAHCPVACIHIAALRVPYEEELYFYKTLMIPYDYELIYALGSMVGVFDIKGMLELINQVEIYGIDAMSTGVTLAWATEAMMKGIITTKDTLGLKLRWGDYETYIKVLRNIVNKPNEFYQQLANGVETASKRYGGRDFALAFGGNEMPGYHTGPVTVTSYLVGSRHSHLDAAGYSIDQAILKGDKISIDEAVQKLYDEESWRQIISGLVICFFARGIYDIDTVVQALGVSGIKKDKAELDRLGHEILELKYRFKKQNGFKPEELRIPARVLETESARGPISEEDVRYAVSKYYELLENQAHG